MSDNATPGYDQFVSLRAKYGRQTDARSSGELREEIATRFDRWETLVSAGSDRDLTAEEVTECKQLDRAIRGLQLELSTAEARDGKAAGDVLADIAHAVGANHGESPRGPQVWRDQHGKPVYALGKNDRWRDLPATTKGYDPEATLGEFLQCAITGGWRNASPGVRAAMQEGANSGGGFLVPEEMLRRVIDLARAKSVVMQAGAITIPMSSDSLTVARLATDPVFEAKSENAAFTGSDLAFDALHFSAHTVGTVITTSRELAEDAPNFQQMVETTLAGAFGAAFDRIAVSGVASSHLDGLLDWTSGAGLIGETGSVGAIAWEDLATAVVGVQAANHAPNAYIAHPTIAGALAALTSGDGLNSAKSWLGPPPNVAPLTPLVTTNIATDSLIVGQFDQFVWAIRQGALIEVSRNAGDAFAKHQVLIKLTWRGDTGALRRDAFHRLVGITT
ncbi:MAG: phage major capsid protein [Pirellulaceae bacterium]